MKKQTKRKNNNKRKTRKYYGGKNTNISENKKGIIDSIGDKLYNYSKDTRNFLTEKGLRLLGLQTIPKDKDNIENVDKKIDNLSDASSSMVSGILSSAEKIGSDVANVVDKSSAALIGQVNDVLESPKIENSISEAAEETAQISEKLLENVNEKLNNPILKKETEIVLDNVGDYAEIAVDALNKPLNKGIDELNEAGSHAMAGIASGAIKVGTDALAAVPGLGAVIEIGKIANDTSKAVGEVVEAGKDTATTISDIVKETNKNIHEGIEKLDEVERIKDINTKEVNNNFKNINNDGKKISNRINKSINEFEKPTPYKGGKKTKSKNLGNISKKTKRVRFSI